MRQRNLVALAGAVLLTVLHTWPLASNPAGLSRLDNADTVLNTWVVAWVAHALPRAPLQLFDAPMFHPERRTLAYSEPLLVPGIMALPLRAAGMSAAATYNLLAMAGLALSAWAMWRLVTHWTADPVAGAVAGMAFAFNAHLLTRFGHLQALHAEFVPLVLLAVDRVARRARYRDGVLLGVAIALVGLVSIYQLAFVAGATVVGLLARRGDWRDAPGPMFRTAALGIGLSLVAAGAAAVAVPGGQPRHRRRAHDRRDGALRRDLARLPRHRRAAALRAVERALLPADGGAVPGRGRDAAGLRRPGRPSGRPRPRAHVRGHRRARPGHVTGHGAALLRMAAPPRAAAPGHAGGRTLGRAVPDRPGRCWPASGLPPCAAGPRPGGGWPWPSWRRCS